MPRPLRLGVPAVASHRSAGACTAGDAAGEEIGVRPGKCVVRHMNQTLPAKADDFLLCVVGGLVLFLFPSDNAEQQRAKSGIEVGCDQAA